MENQRIKAEDFQSAYRCTFSDDRRMVTVLIGTQWISPCKLQFGEDLPTNSSMVPEQFNLILEAPIQDGCVMLAMAKVEIYSYIRKQHARFGKSIDQEDFLTKLSDQIRKLVHVKGRTKASPRPATRTHLEGLVDQISASMGGDVEERARGFAKAWLDKNLATAGDIGEILFLASAQVIYKQEYARRTFHQPKEEE